MDLTVYNPQKGRLETIAVEFTHDNTTWFDNCKRDSEIRMITDFTGGIIIKENNHDYPILIYDASRAAIGYSKKKAGQLMRLYTLKNRNTHE